MSNRDECYRISRMSVHELLDYVLNNPEYLADSYYHEFRRAIHSRKAELSHEAEPTHAQMYAWLREQHWNHSPLAVVLDPKKAIKLGYSAPFGDLLDSTIRELMKKGM